ncbi:hypothetical protein P154DRAFT_115872 [Amniculicola lignicola CBS 123094]|uniref:Uncharacterized protein n=1 Tax=Amniculicola lignicola CBS 123094 TaxID=1392246 RepID=A0A6A5WZG2_9PLEO|nr:hypothetical protein P154DRAFT_115872 [Amniculicola lignicola CBS 123094]
MHILGTVDSVDFRCGQSLWMLFTCLTAALHVLRVCSVFVHVWSGRSCHGTVCSFMFCIIVSLVIAFSLLALLLMFRGQSELGLHDVFPCGISHKQWCSSMLCISGRNRISFPGWRSHPCLLCPKACY